MSPKTPAPWQSVKTRLWLPMASKVRMNPLYPSAYQAGVAHGIGDPRHADMPVFAETGRQGSRECYNRHQMSQTARLHNWDKRIVHVLLRMSGETMPSASVERTSARKPPPRLPSVARMTFCGFFVSALRNTFNADKCHHGKNEYEASHPPILPIGTQPARNFCSAHAKAHIISTINISMTITVSTEFTADDSRMPSMLIMIRIRMRKLAYRYHGGNAGKKK